MLRKILKLKPKSKKKEGEGNVVSSNKPKEFEKEPEKKLNMQEQIRETYKFMNKIKENIPPPKRSFIDKLTGKKSMEKTYKLPKKLTVGSKSKLKKNYALIFLIGNNGCLNPYFEPIINGMVYVRQNGTYHLANAEYMLKYTQGNKQFPALLLPEWSLEPFSPSEHHQQTEKEGKSSLPQKVIINAMKMAQLKPAGMGMQGKTLLWVLAAVVGALYLISQMINPGS